MVCPYLQLLQGAGARFAIANEDDDVPFTHAPAGQAVRVVMDAMFSNLAWRHVLARHFAGVKALQTVCRLLQSCVTKACDGLSSDFLCDLELRTVDQETNKDAFGNYVQ